MTVIDFYIVWLSEYYLAIYDLILICCIITAASTVWLGYLSVSAFKGSLKLNIRYYWISTLFYFNMHKNTILWSISLPVYM